MTCIISRNIIISLALSFTFFALFFPSSAFALTTRLFNNSYYDVANVDNYLYLKIHGANTFTYVLDFPRATDVNENYYHVAVSVSTEPVPSYKYSSSTSYGTTKIEQTFTTKKRVITRQLICNSKSPHISLNYSVKYLSDLNPREEYFDITFKSSNESVMTRDFRFTTAASSLIYFTDPLTPLYFKEFNASIRSSMLGNSYQLTKILSAGKRTLRIYMNDFRFITTFYFNDLGQKVHIKHQRVKANDIKQLSLVINANETKKPVLSFRFANGAEGTFIFNNHPDFSTSKATEAVIYGRSSSGFSSVTSGFVGRGLKATWGVFYKSSLRGWS